MFGLPLSTTLLVFGFPILWVVYTICFLYLSRDWINNDDSQDGSA